MSDHQGGTDGVDGLPFMALSTFVNQMVDAKSATEMLDVLDRAVDGPIFGYTHAKFAYHGLATWKFKVGLTPSEKASPVLPRLAARVQRMAEDGQFEPREAGGVLFWLGVLGDHIDVPEGLLMALIKSLREKPSGSVSEWWLSNRVWALRACAKLNFYHEELLVSVAQHFKSGDALKKQHPIDLFNLLWFYDVLDSGDKFAEFENAMKSERDRRDLRASDWTLHREWLMS